MSTPAKACQSDRIRADIVAAGYSDSTADALMAFDAGHFQYVRLVMNGDVPRTLMENLQSELKATQFHALSAILRIQNGHGRPHPQEVTVGSFAEELNLDPSRASRIAADLVERGLLTRAVSQQDGRRSVLVPTEAACTLLEAFVHARWQRTLRLFASWSEADIAAFTTLFGRFTDGMRAQYPGRG